MKLFVDTTKLRIGIGSILIGWAVAKAKHMGAVRLFIEADPGAAQFYRRMGAYDVGVASSGSIVGRLLPKLALDLT
jgi:GNAT superfamily N-acetyltransferase